jgi:uncharacterized membrane protein YhaH (DUF805 family)
MTSRVGKTDASARTGARDAQEDSRFTETPVESNVKMSASEALFDMFAKPFGFSGTASRKEFGFKILWAIILGFAQVFGWQVLKGLDQLDFPNIIGVLIWMGAFLTWFWMVAILIWSIVYGLPLYARRMRDTGQNAWMVALVFFVIAAINFIDPTRKAQLYLNFIFIAYLSLKPSAKS